MVRSEKLGSALLSTVPPSSEDVLIMTTENLYDRFYNDDKK